MVLIFSFVSLKKISKSCLFISYRYIVGIPLQNFKPVLHYDIYKPFGRCNYWHLENAYSLIDAIKTFNQAPFITSALDWFRTIQGFK